MLKLIHLTISILNEAMEEGCQLVIFIKGPILRDPISNFS